MASLKQLYGPPDVYKFNPKTTTTIPSSSTNPPMGLTENLSATYLSTGNPCLDFFFHILPNTPSKSVEDRLQLAWAFNPLTTLKLVCHLRDVRGTGKSNKEGFYAAALWLHEHHPKTLALNIKLLSNFGYLKDLPDILYRILEGLDVHEREKADREEQKSGPLHWIRGKRIQKKETKTFMSHGQRVSIQKGVKPSKKQIEKMSSKQKTVAMAKKAMDKYFGDANYRFLHNQISEVFAELLRADLKFLESGNKGKISLAAKWCPSLDSSYDRSTLLCESIARRLFPCDSDPIYEQIEEAHYAYRVRDRLRKEVLVPLRRTLELPELYMSSNNWSTLPYNRVSSVAMKTYKSRFTEHDGQRFSEFLGSVEKGEAKISAGALLPHEIMVSAVDFGDEAKVGELQWQRMVEDISKIGKFKNCLAVCDVSGSMGGTPILVCIALGILLSELCEDPWKGRVITFSANPQLQEIKGTCLREKKSSLVKMDWGENTDFQKVFDQILDMAVTHKLSKDKMIKRLFVFSDMEFDQASSRNWETDHQVIESKFQKRGYEVPEIVFWNLTESKSTPVTGSKNGVALVSGYSKNIMKLFLKGDGILNSEAIMEQAISGEEYKGLMVYD